MKILEAGTIKYLLTDPEQINRNIRRQARLGAPAVIAEVTPDVRGGITFHTGFGVIVEGPVHFQYQKSGKGLAQVPALLGRRRVERAAYVTDGKVAIAETAEEAASTALAGRPGKTDTKPAAKTKATKPKTKETKQ